MDFTFSSDSLATGFISLYVMVRSLLKRPAKTCLVNHKVGAMQWMCSLGAVFLKQMVFKRTNVLVSSLVSQGTRDWLSQW